MRYFKHFPKFGRILGPGAAFLLLLVVACGSAAEPGNEAADPSAAEPTGADAAQPTSVTQPTSVEQPTPVPASTVHQGKVTVMVSALGNERFDRTFSTGADKNHGRLLSGLLIETNENTELIPGIATEWGISEDGLAWDFTIREGVKYHDGTDMTPQDVHWSLDHQFGPEAFNYVVSSTHVAYSRLMDKIEMIGPDVVSVRFTQVETSYPAYISAAGPAWMSIMPKRDQLRDEAVEAAFEKHPIGTGPMKFVRHVPAEVIEWERFDDYYFQPANGLYEDRRVNFTSLDLRAVPEEATRVAALRAGEADIAPVSLQAREQVNAGGGRLVFGQEGGYIRVILAGCWADPTFPCGDKRVRHALAYALDKELMRDQLFGGPDVMELKGWAAVTPSTIGYTPDLAPFPFDPDQARQLLAEAGYRTPDNPSGNDFGKLVVNTWVSAAFPFLPESAQLAAEMWNRELGIDAEVRVGDESALKNAHRAGDINGTILWRDNETRVDAASIQRSSYGNPESRRRLHDNQEIFDLIDETLAIYDPVEQPKALNRLYQRLQDEQYEIGLGHVNIPWAVGPRIDSERWKPYPLAFWLSSYHTIFLK